MPRRGEHIHKRKDGYYEAINIYPARTEAYNKLIDYYKNYGAENDSIARIGNELEKHADQLDTTLPDVAQLYYDTGKLYFADYDGALKARAANAKGYFEVASNGTADFGKKDIASCYYSICKFMTSQSTTSEHALDDYTKLFEEINQAMAIVENANDPIVVARVLRDYLASVYRLLKIILLFLIILGIMPWIPFRWGFMMIRILSIRG